MIKGKANKICYNTKLVFASEEDIKRFNNEANLQLKDPYIFLSLEKKKISFIIKRGPLNPRDIDNDTNRDKIITDHTKRILAV